jgi:hypothetical protein
MKKFTLFATSTAVAALMALPVSALSLDTGAKISVTANDSGVSAGASAETTAGTGGTGEAAVATGTEAVAEAQTEAEATSDFIGDIVVSSEGQTVGMVDSVKTDAEGQMQLVVTLDGAIESSVSQFAVAIDASAESDGEVKLGWTTAELVATLEAQASASGSNG